MPVKSNMIGSSDGAGSGRRLPVEQYRRHHFFAFAGRIHPDDRSGERGAASGAGQPEYVSLRRRFRDRDHARCAQMPHAALGEGWWINPDRRRAAYRRSDAGSVRHPHPERPGQRRAAR